MLRLATDDGKSYSQIEGRIDGRRQAPPDDLKNNQNQSNQFWRHLLYPRESGAALRFTENLTAQAKFLN
jgi:hypothetical protein